MYRLVLDTQYNRTQQKGCGKGFVVIVSFVMPDTVGMFFKLWNLCTLFFLVSSLLTKFTIFMWE